jgi:phosphotransferase system  glucose/maltose/N-acetylglucosamine-specific IIC component
MMVTVTVTMMIVIMMIMMIVPVIEHGINSLYRRFIGTIDQLGLGGYRIG